MPPPDSQCDGHGIEYTTYQVWMDVRVFVCVCVCVSMCVSLHM